MISADVFSPFQDTRMKAAAAALALSGSVIVGEILGAIAPRGSDQTTKPIVEAS